MNRWDKIFISGFLISFLLMLTVGSIPVNAYTQGTSSKGVKYQITSMAPTILTTNRTGYAYEMTGTGYDAYFKTNSNTADSIRFEKNGYYFIYDVSGGQMQWAVLSGQPNAKDTLGGGKPSSSQTTSVSISGNVATYQNAFYNTTLTYTLTNDMLKENFIILGFSKAAMKNYTYLEYSGNIQFNSSLDICTDSQCYVPSGTQDDFETDGKIYFKDIQNKTIFYLAAPTVTDATGNTIKGLYSVHGSNAQMNFWLRINKTFLENAVYPVKIDPTVVSSDASPDLKGVVYTPECLFDCHLPFAITYTGTTEPATITLTPSSRTNIDWILNKVNSDNVVITDIKYLENTTQNVTEQVPVYSNITHQVVLNENGTYTLPENCVSINSTEYNCNEITSYTSNSITITVSQWKSFFGSSLTMTKDAVYYLDFVGKRGRVDKTFATDLIPSIDGLSLTELAWWNSSFRKKVSITINTTGIIVAPNFTVPVFLNSSVLNFANVRSDCGDLRVVNATENGELSYWLKSCRTNANNQTEIYINWINTTLNPNIWIYYNNSAATTSSSTKVFSYINTFENETVGNQPANLHSYAPYSGNQWTLRNVLNDSGMNVMNLYGQYIAADEFTDMAGKITAFGTPILWSYSFKLIDSGTLNTCGTNSYSYSNTNRGISIQHCNNGTGIGYVSNDIGSLNILFSPISTGVWYGIDIFMNVTDSSTGTAFAYLNNSKGNSMAQQRTWTWFDATKINYIQDVASGNVNLSIDNVGLTNGTSDMPKFSFSSEQGLGATVAIQNPTNTTYGSTSVILNFTATSTETVDKCWYKLDGGANTSLPSCANITLTSLSRQTHSLFVYVNTTSAVESFSSISFTIDNTNPTITMQKPNLPPDNVYNSPNVTLNYTASDLFLDTCVRQLDGVNSTISPKCANQTMIGLSDGSHTVKVFVNDTVNNTNATDLRTFIVDTLAPLPDIQSPANGATYNTLNISLNYMIYHPTGTLDKCWYILNGGANISLPNCINITFLAANNSNNITVYANDTAGNTGLHSHIFNVDITAPSVTIFSPSNTTYYGNTSIFLTYTASDPNGVTCIYRINGSSYTAIPSCNNISISGFSNGFFVLDLNTTDNFNNSRITEVNFTVFHGVNLSAFLPNFTALTNWNVSASNGTVTNNFTITSNPQLIDAGSLPQGTVIFNATKTGYDSESWTTTVSGTMGLQQHDFHLYPLTNVTFFYTSTSTFISGWTIYTVPTFFNTTVSGTTFVVSNRIFPNGTLSFYGSMTGYFTNSTTVTNFVNSTSYNIQINTSKTQIVMYTVDEQQTGQKHGFNAQFITTQGNVTVLQVTGYRRAVSQNCYDGDINTGCFGASTGNSPNTTSSAIFYGQDYNNANYNMTWEVDANNVGSCQNGNITIYANGQSIFSDFMGPISNSVSYRSTIIPVQNVLGNYTRAINFTIVIVADRCGSVAGSTNLIDFRMINNTAGYNYVDDNTITLPVDTFANITNVNVFYRGEETYETNYTQTRMLIATLSQFANYNLVGYLLRDTQGFMQHFIVLNTNNVPLGNALVTIGKWFTSGVETPITQCFSNIAGACNLWLQPNTPLYSLLSQLTGYQTNYTRSILFTGTPNPAYIYMQSGQTVNFTSVFNNIMIALNPTDQYQNNATLVTCQIVAGDGNLNFINLTAYRTLNTTIVSLYNSSYVDSQPSGGTLSVGLNANGRFDVFCTYQWVSNASGTTKTYQNVASRTFWIYSDRLRDSANQQGNNFGGEAGIILTIGIILLVAGPIAFYSPSYGLAVGMFLMLIFMWLGMMPWYVGGLAILTGIAVLIMRAAL